MIVFLGSIIGAMVDPIQFVAIMICIRFKIWPLVYIPMITAGLLVFYSSISVLNHNYFSVKNISAKLIAISITAAIGYMIIKFNRRNKIKHSDKIAIATHDHGGEK